MNLPMYFIVGMRPVKMIATPSGGMAVLKMNWETGVFEYGMEYLSRALSNDADVDSVKEAGFIDHVECLRQELAHDDGALQAIYDVIVATEALAKEEGRGLTGEEVELLRALRHQTHAAFEAAHPYTFRP
jgi:hypothetical protein